MTSVPRFARQAEHGSALHEARKRNASATHHPRYSRNTPMTAAAAPAVPASTAPRWPVRYLLFIGGLSSIPTEIYEAGSIDGATGLSRESSDQLITPGLRCGSSPVSSRTRMAIART